MTDSRSVTHMTKPQVWQALFSNGHLDAEQPHIALLISAQEEWQKSTNLMSDHYHNLSIANLNVPSADFYAQNWKYFSMPHFSSRYVCHRLGKVKIRDEVLYFFLNAEYQVLILILGFISKFLIKSVFD